MNNINCVTEEKNKCFGCRACANICPVSAITMKEDDEGFFYPIIDNNKCTNCGLCKKACPSLNKSKTYLSNNKNPDCYALMADDETRLVSSSGGAFTLIANWIFEQGGYVCGVAFVGQNVQHIIIDKKDDLYKLRGSKYVQSDTNTVYSQIKDLLNQDKYVLFTGTPCQVAGLYSFLGKDYEKLYTVDLICHGVPPQKVFDMYLADTIQKDDVFAHTTFRDKKAGWTVYTTTTTTGKHYYGGSLSKDTYLQAFINNMCLRPSCGTCPYTSTQREADITIGDFWAIERFDKNLNDNKGTSVILLNSHKGRELFSSIKNNFVVCREVPLEYASYYNITLYTPLKQHTNRKAFFRVLNKTNSLKQAVDYCSKNQYDCAILNFWPHRNMGGVLQAWALQDIISELGYSNVLLNYQCKTWENAYSDSFVERFANKYLFTTKAYYSELDLIKSNQICDTFIIGSDCLWAKWSNEQNFRNIFMGSFADLSKKLISYAPSFGNAQFCGNCEEILNAKYFLNRFDYISVRENSGVDILKNIFNLNSTQCLDPTLVLSQEKFNRLALKSKYNNKNYIFNYSIGIKNDDLAYPTLLDKLKNENVFALSQFQLQDTDVEDFLYLIKNASLLITNSYHACCLAIKFNVPFYIFSPSGLDTSRFDSLLGILHLESRILRTNEDIYKLQNLFEPIDWDRVNSILAKEKERSLKWLKDALEAPKDLSKIDPAAAVIKNLNDKISYLQNTAVNNAGLVNILNYNKNYRRYIKYKILKNFVFGSTRSRYRKKQKLYHEKIKSARRIKKGITCS